MNLRTLCQFTAIGAIVAIPSWILVPRYMADSEMRTHGTTPSMDAVTPDKYALVVDEYRKTLSQAIGGLGLVGTLLISVATLRSTERAKLSERFAKALDHLGAVRSSGEIAASEVRIGAVAELEGIGEESMRERRMIQSSFVAYLRHYAFLHAAIEDKRAPAVWRMKETQAMMSVIARWGISPESTNDLRLSDVDLRHLQLPDANLSNLVAERSCFDFANMERTTFKGVKFGQSKFRGTRLDGADFRGSELSQCDFTASRHSNPELNWGWNRNKKRFSWGGDSSDAKMAGADMRGVDLSSVVMTQGQYDSVVKDANTRSPKCLMTPSQ